jgi:hypothetical protein
MEAPDACCGAAIAELLADAAAAAGPAAAAATATALALDEDVRSYLAGVLAALAADNSLTEQERAEDLADAVSGFSEPFAVLGTAERAALAGEAVASAAAGRAAAAAARAAAAGAAAAVDAARRLASLDARLAGPSSSSGSDDGLSEGEDAPPPASAAEADALRFLAPMSPGTPRSFLLEALLRARCAGDAAAAAAWLADAIAAGELGDALDAWAVADKARAAARAAAAAERAAERRAVAARFRLQAEPSGGAAAAVAAWAPPAGTHAAPKVRYRDGAIATTKGEKIVIEKAPEWDGGSKGRVKSKGKRGVGWQ